MLFVSERGGRLIGFVDVRLHLPEEEVTLARPMTSGYAQQLIVTEAERSLGAGYRAAGVIFLKELGPSD